MKHLLLCLFALACGTIGHAQVRGTQKRGAVHVFVRLSGDLHFNGSDKVDREARYDGLTVQNKTGSSFAIEFQRMTRSRFYLAAGGLVKIVPQELEIVYDPSKLGYGPGSSMFSENLSYTNVYAGLTFHAGYSALLQPRSAIEFDWGLNFLFPLNSKKEEKRYYEHISSPDYTDLIAYRKTLWGSETPVALFSLRLAYRGYQGVLFHDRSFRVGLQGTLLPGSNYENGGNTRTELQFYGPNRQSLGRQYFYDRHLGLSLFVDLEL